MSAASTTATNAIRSEWLRPARDSVLTLRKREGTKHQNPGAQSRVKASDRFRMVKMDAEQPVFDAPPADAEGEAK